MNSMVEISEWKRHRGGPIPVDAKVVVEVKLRDSTLETHRAECFNWDHDKTPDDIMQYRVISQPQAKEVKLSKVEARRPFMGEPTWTVIDEAPDYSVGQWHQIDGPIKWRDTIIELEARAEDIQREIASLHNRLTEEGFSLIRQYPSAQQPEFAVDMSDWRNWKAGDEVEVVLDNDAELPIGRKYFIKEIEVPDYAYGMPVCVRTGSGPYDYQWPEDLEHKDRLVFKFIRRP